jgi:uncharacterized protein YbjT (DUF2867 family)
MSIKTLVIGAGGSVGHYLMEELDKDPGDLDITYTTIFPHEVEKWEQEGRKAVLMNLDNVEEIKSAMEGMERVFLLTTYSADMLKWTYHVVDIAKKAGVKYMVHHGTYTSPDDELELTPHFIWQRMAEAYIAQSGIAWCNVHPNNIVDTNFRSVTFGESSTAMLFWGEGAEGIVWAADIGAVEAAVLREGPEKHSGKNYYLSTEVVTIDDMSAVLSEIKGEPVTILKGSVDDIGKAFAASSPTTGFRYYGDSATFYMYAAQNNLHPKKLEVRDDCITVLGRPGKTFAEGAKEYLLK